MKQIEAEYLKLFEKKIQNFNHPKDMIEIADRMNIDLFVWAKDAEELDLDPKIKKAIEDSIETLNKFRSSIGKLNGLM
jgi:hypothetical protein